MTTDDLKALAQANHMGTPIADVHLMANIIIELSDGVLRLLAQEEARQAGQVDQVQWHKDWIEAVRELKKVQADHDLIEAELVATNVMLDNAVVALRKHKAQQEAREQFERPIREALWINHGCPIPALYGDDGEMQCNELSCRLDFKRQPLHELHALLIGAGRLHVGRIPPRAERCQRCGHPSDWHRADDSQTCDTAEWKFRCLGYDCDGRGFPAGTPESRCGCPDFVRQP